MTSVRKLKHEIEDYFFANYPEMRAIDLCGEWWSGFSSLNLSVPFGAHASKNSQGYETTVTAIKGSRNKIPQLDVWRLQISSAGLCQIKSIETAYPANAGTPVQSSRRQ